MSKIKKVFCMITTMFLLTGCGFLEEKVIDPNTITVPKDFSFSIVWDCYGISSYDSKSGTLIKTNHATHPEDYITKLVLTEEELKTIYIKLTKNIDIYSYSDTYNPFRKGYASSPTQTIIININEGTNTKTVTCKDIAFDFGDGKYLKSQKARNFMKVHDEIVAMLKSSEEWKQLPDYEFGYD